MKKSRKVLWLTIAIVFFMGAALMTIGFFAGASTWVYVDREGIHVASKGSEEVQLKQMEIEQFSNIEIEADFSDVRLEPAEDYGIYMFYYGEKPEFDVKDGTLTVKERKQSRRLHFSLGFPTEMHESEIVVYYPKDAQFGRIAVNVSAGSTKIKNVKAEDLRCDSDFGKITIEEIEANSITAKLSSGDIQIKNVTADFVDISNDFGDIEVQQSAVTNSNIGNNAGRIELDGDFGAAQIENDFGDIAFRTVKPKDQYQYDFIVDFGTVTIDGDSRSGSVSGGSGPDLLKFSTSSGNINVSFVR